MDVCPDDGQCVSGGGYHHPLQRCDGKGDATEEGQRGWDTKGSDPSVSFLHDDFLHAVDVGLGDVAAAVDVGVLQDEPVAGLIVLGVDHLHKVGSIHPVVAVGIAQEANLKRGRYRIAKLGTGITGGVRVTETIIECMHA